MGNIIVIGIAGGTGSGKTTLTRNLASKFADNVTIIKHDDYYRSHNKLTFEQRAELNFDHPDAFETELLIDHLKKLKKGSAVKSPIYDYNLHNRSDKVKIIKPTKVVIVEGILIFENKKLCDLIDIKIFVDTDADIRLIRRIKRDVDKRGRSLNSIINQYVATVKPMHEQFVEPSKKSADLVVLEGGRNIVALDMIVYRVQQFIIN